MDLRELRTILKQGPGLALATRDTNLRPHITDLFGIDVRPDGKKMRVYLKSKESSQALQDIQDNQQVAVSIARPCNYFAGQIKGRVTSSSPMNETDHTISREWGEKYRQEIQLIGMSFAAATALKMEADLVLEVDISEMFVQTPGPDAGRSMTKIEQ